MIIWITGQPGSGKTTLGRALANRLKCANLDGGAMWKMFGIPNDSFVNRARNVAEAQALAVMYTEKKRHVVVSMVSPYRAQREEFKKAMQGQILEVHVHAEDPSRPRQDHRFPGYEPPLGDALFIDTTKTTLEESVKLVLERANLT